MNLVSYWRTAHKRNSVRALIVGVAVPFAGAVWSYLPGAFVNRLPVGVIFGVPCVISALGLLGAYTKQPTIEENNVDAE
ncbi:hypothetical protein [Caballeronia sp. dw_19]|uniref:DUF7940 domain-containing protein n=1 Tax=Caballeronia sp. dw_19 TaxID=2719791 RepID=UPI001BD53604|nr:hypothetical protein [Caballeronia sp. dw_19]